MTQQTWRFLYTNESNIKKALSKDKQPVPGKSKYIVITGKDYAFCYDEAKKQCRFTDKQLIGSRQLTEKEVLALV